MENDIFLNLKNINPNTIVLIFLNIKKIQEYS